MNITIAIDSLKGSLSSLEAGHAIEEGIRRVYKDAAVNVRPLADGGEGTVEALACGMGGTLETVTVTGPMGRPVDCQYGILPESGTAIIEMSGAAGITLVPDAEKDPMKATTFGVGQVIRSAIQKGCRRFIVGIGGSATNDGGTGMLQALGYGILDRDGNQIPPGAQGLAQIASISSEHVLPELSECTFRIACDVNNPLCGPRGASAVYGPQKGADEAMVQVMDRGLAHFAEIAGKWNPKADPEFPGTGAAGGLGFAFLTFTSAVLESGIQIVLEETRLREYVKDADLVITGEGRLDRLSWERPLWEWPGSPKNSISRSLPFPAASPGKRQPATMPGSTPFSRFSAPSSPWRRPWIQKTPEKIWPTQPSRYSVWSRRCGPGRLSKTVFSCFF